MLSAKYAFHNSIKKRQIKGFEIKRSCFHTNYEKAYYFTHLAIFRIGI